jgi:hypothetical protein
MLPARLQTKTAYMDPPEISREISSRGSNRCGCRATRNRSLRPLATRPARFSANTGGMARPNGRSSAKSMISPGTSARSPALAPRLRRGLRLREIRHESCGSRCGRSGDCAAITGRATVPLVHRRRDLQPGAADADRGPLGGHSTRGAGGGCVFLGGGQRV